tara:strand:+ start:238 stop:564 length:327 start_codon:yes stop_codon:yes gene_type:complete
MKLNELKKIVKESVKEAIQEELKDILLEAVRSPKQVVQENVSIPTPQLSSKPTIDAKKSYMDVMNETALSFNSSNVQTFNPRQPGVDPINGNLPAGELSMDQIRGLIK